MIVVLAVLVGGLGASVRFVVDAAIRARLGETFPWGTMIINASGSLALGVLTGLVLRHSVGADLRAVLGTGFCGGYTTFSTASYETVRLAQRGSSLLAVVYSAGTAGLTVGAGAIGLLVTV